MMIAEGMIVDHVKPGLFLFNFGKKIEKSSIARFGEKEAIWFCPVVKFKAKGVEVTVTIKTMYRGYFEYDIGKKVYVDYKENNPNKCKLLKEKGLHF